MVMRLSYYRLINSEASMGSHALGWLAVALYSAAQVCAIVSLVRPREIVARATPLFVAGGLAVHFADLMHRARELSSVPYRTLGGSVSFFGWMRSEGRRA